MVRRRAPSSGLLHRLDPLCPPCRRLPRLAVVDPLADDLAAAELHDADGVVRVRAVVPDGELIDPKILAADRPMRLDVDVGGVRGPEGDDVGPASNTLLALRELQH